LAHDLKTSTIDHFEFSKPPKKSNMMKKIEEEQNLSTRSGDIVDHMRSSSPTCPAATT
jgi:hypothetical protein